MAKKKSVRIEGYLFYFGRLLHFVPKSDWKMRWAIEHSTYISKNPNVCKEGSRIYKAFSKFRGKRKPVTVTMRG
jgi:hypothetical protein